MPVKSNFAAGNILTASDTNTYLTNGGLVYITEATASGTATLNISGCFSSTYDCYRLVASELRSSVGSVDIRYRFLTTGTTPDTTASYGGAWVGISTLNVSTNLNYASQTQGWFSNCYSTTETGNVSVYDIFNPNLSRRTVLIGTSESLNSGLNGFDFRTGGSLHDNTVTTFTGIQFYATSGNLSGKFKVYGYRQA